MAIGKGAVVSALLLTLCTSVLGAQRAQVEDNAGGYSPWSLEQCMLGVSYGAPLKLAAAWAGGLKYEHPEGGNDVCFFGAGKVGFGGARMSAGVGTSLGPLGGGALLSVGVLRTFDEPLNALAKRTYVGASLHVLPLLALGGEIGWYTRIGNDPPGAPKRSMITWSAGFGF